MSRRPLIPDNKTCCDCKCEKPLCDFQRDASKPDGHEYRCKACKSTARMKRHGTYDAHAEREALYAEGKKRCARCGEVKLTREFRVLERKTGAFHAAWCHGCTNAYSREKMREYNARPEVKAAKAAREKLYDKTPVRAAAHRERGREYVSRPEVKAHYKSYMAEYKLRPGKREEMNAAHVRWSRTHPEAARETWRRYYQTPKGKLADQAHKNARRARLANVESTLTRKQWSEILAAFSGRCAYCGSAVRITMDHVVPVSREGGHVPSNVVPACFSCNSRKNDVPLRTFLARLDTTERAFKSGLRAVGWPLAL